jgi:hypothetical protein
MLEVPVKSPAHSSATSRCSEGKIIQRTHIWLKDGQYLIIRAIKKNDIHYTKRGKVETVGRIASRKKKKKI